MIDVSRWPGSQTALGRLIRMPLRLIPNGVVVPIVQGPLRGKRWIVGSGISRLWLGSYEVEKMRLAASLLAPGDVAFDIGANVGIYTLLFSSAVGSTGRVVAFEPSLTNVSYLRRHLSLNGVENVSVVNAAVSVASGKALFDAGQDSSTGHLSTAGTLAVSTIRLDDFVISQACRPTLVKIDVEGAEVDVLHGAMTTLRLCAPTLLLATHSSRLKAACIELLESHGYSVTELVPQRLSDELIAVPRRHAST